jgi:heat shock protein HslJ
MQNQLKSLGRVKRISPTGSGNDRAYATGGGNRFHGVAWWSDGMFTSRPMGIALRCCGAA